MAFVKRTWLARIGTGLNKFIIGEKDANDKQTLTNSPDSVTQQGDVISAENLNDLEDRIATAVNAISLTKIWENLNPTGEFVAQTIDIGETDSPMVIEFNPVASPLNTRGWRYLGEVTESGGAYTSLERTSIQKGAGETYALSITSRSIIKVKVSGIIQLRIDDAIQFGYKTTVSPPIHEFAINNSLNIPIAIYKVGDIYNTEE